MGYEESKIAVDAVILSINAGKLQVLLHNREKDPFKGSVELLGGLLLDDEDACTTITRKLQGTLEEEFFVEQFQTFTKPNRDPRGRVVTIGFIALVRSGLVPYNTSWYGVENLPRLAFDHNEIIEAALLYLKQNISPRLLSQMLPELFPLNLLQKVYELIEDKKYDNRNFRKKMLNSGFIEQTDELEKNVSHRPAKLCKFIF